MSSLFLRTLARRSGRRRGRQPPAARAGRLHPPGRGRHLLVAAARVTGCCARSSRSCARRWTAPAPRRSLLPILQPLRAVAAHRPRRRLRPADVPARSTARRPASASRPTAEEVITTIVAQEYTSLPRPAGEPVPDQLEVPRRAAAALRPAARPRVPDEGRVLLRRRRRRPARAATSRCTTRTTACSSAAASRSGRSRRSRARSAATSTTSSWPSPRSAKTTSCGADRATTPPTSKPRAAAPRPTPSQLADGRRARRWRRCTRPTCPGSRRVAELLGVDADAAAEVHRVRRRRRARARARARRPRGERVRARAPRSRRSRCGCTTDDDFAAHPEAAEGLHRPAPPRRDGRRRRPVGRARRSRGSPARTRSTTTCATPCSAATSRSTCGPIS